METKQVKLTVTVQVESSEFITHEGIVSVAKKNIHDSKYSSSMFKCNIIDIEEASDD